MRKDKIGDLLDEAEAAQKAAQEKIEAALDQGGPYTHNIVSSVLRSLSEKYGTVYANAIVGELELEDLLGISPVN